MFWGVGWPLLWAGGFFCNLDILYGGLGIGKLQFLIKKNLIFFSAVIFFFNFWSLKPWIRIGSGSVSGSVLASIRILWIRIRIRKKWIRIRNPDLESTILLTTMRFTRGNHILQEGHAIFVLHDVLWFPRLHHSRGKKSNNAKKN